MPGPGVRLYSEDDEKVPGKRKEHKLVSPWEDDSGSPVTGGLCIPVSMERRFFGNHLGHSLLLWDSSDRLPCKNEGDPRNCFRSSFYMGVISVNSPQNTMKLGLCAGYTSATHSD